MPIRVEELDADTYEVTVDDAVTSTHKVHVPDDAFRDLAAEGATKAELVERSFEFLLAREPNTSILAEFEITVIGRYFPEYPSEIKKYFDQC